VLTPVTSYTLVFIPPSLYPDRGSFGSTGLEHPGDRSPSPG
jgi:hypothetical protein